MMSNIQGLVALSNMPMGQWGAMLYSLVKVTLISQSQVKFGAVDGHG